MKTKNEINGRFFAELHRDVTFKRVAECKSQASLSTGNSILVALFLPGILNLHKDDNVMGCFRGDDATHQRSLQCRNLLLSRACARARALSRSRSLSRARSLSPSFLSLTRALLMAPMHSKAAIEPRISIYGNDPLEWQNLAVWFCKFKVEPARHTTSHALSRAAPCGLCRLVDTDGWVGTPSMDFVMAPLHAR